VIKIVFKNAAANGVDWVTYSGDFDSQAFYDYLEGAKFLWVDETTFVAVDNISHIVKVD